MASLLPSRLNPMPDTTPVADNLLLPVTDNDTTPVADSLLLPVDP